MNPPQASAEGTYRPTVAIIDLDALGHNLHQISSRLPEGIELCAIVKADAYGHGAVPISRELDTLGVNGFAVATVEEGIELRTAGIRKPILVMGASVHGMDEALDHALTPVIYSLHVADVVSQAARHRGHAVGVHIKLDTGMGRLGILPSEWRKHLRRFLNDPWLRVEGILSHYSSAEKDPAFTALQLTRFKRALALAAQCGISGAQYHIAKSAGILAFPQGHYDLVRPGILLYGSYPDPSLRSRIEVRPVMNLRTQILHAKTVPKDTPISYGQTFRTRKRSIIATLPIGYADGYRRDLSNKGWVLVHGRRAPVVGNVTMDLTMVDVTQIPGVKEGDEVILFGAGREGLLPVDDLASCIGTIPYELLCGISRRVPRVYLKGGKVCTW